MSEEQAANPSQWQKNIEGQWYGTPSVFDAQGNYVGRIKVNRSSVFEDGKTTYTMDTDLEQVTGPLRARFEARDFAFGVLDSDQDRIYLGPDFVGAGHPYGMLVDAHYYSPAWTADLRTMVHIMPDAKTQVYSSLLYDGPSIVGVFNGLYEVAHDYDSNPETKARIDAFLDRERRKGGQPHVLPFKHEGKWTGQLQVYDAEHHDLGTVDVEMNYRPLTLLRAKMDVHMTGAVERHYSFERSRVGHRHVFEGPDVYGNSIGYGRALYTSQHFFGRALKVRGREFIVDDDFTMSVAWQVFGSDKPMHMIFGKLDWEPGEQVLKANYQR